MGAEEGTGGWGVSNQMQAMKNQVGRCASRRLKRLLIVSNDFQAIFEAWCQMVVVGGGNKETEAGVYNRLLIPDEKTPQGALYTWLEET